MYKEGLKYTHVNQDDMCTYTNKTEMDTLAWIKHKVLPCTFVNACSICTYDNFIYLPEFTPAF
jgi:hypothetical protein